MATKIQRRLVEAAASIMADSADEITFLHSTLCQTCLPHRAPPEDTLVWKRQQGRARLLVQAGAAWHAPSQEWVYPGLPYGPKARMILMHLSSEALKARSPIVEVEASLTAFVRRVQDRPPTGPELTAFKEQLARLAAATIQLAVDYDENHAVQVDTKIVGGVDFWFEKNERQRVLWPATVKLSLDYFDSLQRHAVPLDERAIAALAHSAMALDIYCWLSQRLHRVLPAGQRIGWAALHEQFGQGYARIRRFREFFLRPTSPGAGRLSRGALHHRWRRDDPRPVAAPGGEATGYV